MRNRLQLKLSSGLGMLLAASAGAVVGCMAGIILSPTAVEGSGAESDELVEVLVAGRTIPAGTDLGYAVVTRKRMPARFVSRSMVRPEFVGQLVGESVLITILEGDPIMWSHLASGAPEAICDWVREANRRRTPTE